MEIDLVGESIKFMFLGMTIVIVFLMVLVQVVKIQAKLINKFFPEKEPEAVKPNNDTQDAHHVAAIVAAVSEFRKNQ